MSKPVAIVVGVGASQGLGAALCRRFAREGFLVLVGGRTLQKIERVVTEITEQGGEAIARLIDASKESDIKQLFDDASNVGADYAPPSVILFNAGNNKQIPFEQTTANEFEDFWRIGCYAGFLVGRESVKHLLPQNAGTIIFTGATASLRGRPGYAHFSAAKAGLRMISQSMAREFGPQGIHVAHVIVDGQIDGDRVNQRMPDAKLKKGEHGLLDIDAIAETYWQIHKQPRSAWTHEIDLRPYKEPF